MLLLSSSLQCVFTLSKTFVIMVLCVLRLQVAEKLHRCVEVSCTYTHTHTHIHRIMASVPMSGLGTGLCYET